MLRSDSPSFCLQDTWDRYSSIENWISENKLSIGRTELEENMNKKSMTSHKELDSSPRPWGLLVANAQARSRTTTSPRDVLYDVKLFPCFTELLTWNFRAMYLGLDFHGFNVLKSISISQIKSASMGTCGLIKTEKLLAFYQILCWWQIPIHKHPVSTAGLSKTVLCLIPVSLDGEISPSNQMKPEDWQQN